MPNECAEKIKNAAKRVVEGPISSVEQGIRAREAARQHEAKMIEKDRREEAKRAEKWEKDNLKRMEKQKKEEAEHARKERKQYRRVIKEGEKRRQAEERTGINVRPRSPVIDHGDHGGPFP